MTENQDTLQAKLQEIQFQLASYKNYNFEDEGAPTRKELVKEMISLQRELKKYNK